MYKELAIDLLNNYEKQTITRKKKNRCFWKYFWHGFTHLISPPERKWCPHCCKIISEEEYWEGYIFSYGCSKCRIKTGESNESD